MKNTKTTDKQTEIITRFKVVEIADKPETPEEAHQRRRELATTQRRRARAEYDAKHAKTVATKPAPDTANMTIEQEDYWYRKEMREAMDDEECDMFTHRW